MTTGNENKTKNERTELNTELKCHKKYKFKKNELALTTHQSLTLFYARPFHILSAHCSLFLEIHCVSREYVRCTQLVSHLREIPFIFIDTTSQSIFAVSDCSSAATEWWLDSTQMNCTLSVDGNVRRIQFDFTGTLTSSSYIEHSQIVFIEEFQLKLFRELWLIWEFFRWTERLSPAPFEMDACSPDKVFTLKNANWLLVCVCARK